MQTLALGLPEIHPRQVPSDDFSSSISSSKCFFFSQCLWDFLFICFRSLYRQPLSPCSRLRPVALRTGTAFHDVASGPCLPTTPPPGSGSRFTDCSFVHDVSLTLMPNSDACGEWLLYVFFLNCPLSSPALPSCLFPLPCWQVPDLTPTSQPSASQ